MTREKGPWERGCCDYRNLLGDVTNFSEGQATRVCGWPRWRLDIVFGWKSSADMANSKVSLTTMKNSFLP